MDLKGYIKLELDGLKRSSSRTLDTLTQAELSWRPACGCNSLGLILFHIARSEDHFISEILQKKPQIWVSGKWCERCNMDEAEAGAHYTLDQVNAFCVPDKKAILDYYDAVRAGTVAYLECLDPADFDNKIKLPFGDFNVAGIFSLIVAHTSQHIGEISYLRGMLRGMDK